MHKYATEFVGLYLSALCVGSKAQHNIIIFELACYLAIDEKKGTNEPVIQHAAASEFGLQGLNQFIYLFIYSC